MTEKPNIIVVLADDMGLGDTRCYDPAYCQVDTPYMQFLADNSVLFETAYCPSPLYMPSRSAFMRSRLTATAICVLLRLPYSSAALCHSRACKSGFSNTLSRLPPQ